MKRWGLAVVALGAMAAAAPAQDAMQNGAAAYNAGNFASAVQQFELAVKADPQSLLARQHLANARVQRFLSASPFDREALLKAARQSLADVLARSPKDSVALWHMAAVELDLGNLDEAAAWCRKLTAADPKNRDGHYTLGVIQWMEAYNAITAAKRKLGLNKRDPFPAAAAATRDALRASLQTNIAEGRKSLERAAALDPDYAAALAYDNLLYRVEADLAGTPAETQILLARAEEQLKKARSLYAAEKSSGLRAMVRHDVPPPATVPAPPPPPPPPPSSGR